MIRSGIPFALFSAVLFGASTPFAKLLLGTVDPWLLAGLLYLGAGLGLAAVHLLGEPLSATLLAAAGLMGVGLWLHLAERHEHEHAHELLEHEHRHRHDEHHTHDHAPGIDSREPHTHPHRHEPMRHRHPHYPDLHHRHGHRHAH